MKIESLDIKRGITTGLDVAFILKNPAKAELLNKQPEIQSFIKPLLRGKDITKYLLKPSGLSLLFIPWHFPLHLDKNINGSSVEAETALQKQFPSLYSHLEEFKDKLSNRNKEETGIRYEWYALQRCANTYYDDFEKDKIVWGLISGNWGFSYDNDCHFLTSASFFITSSAIPLKFILALFNSDLYRYFFIKIGEYTAGGAYVLKKTTIEKFIIPTIDEAVQKSIIEKVDKVMELKQKGEDTLILVNEIDDLIYAIFDITEEDQKVIKEQLNG